HVELRTYEHAEGTYRGRQGEIFVPAYLAPVVEGVFGLDDRPQVRPRSRWTSGADRMAEPDAPMSFKPPEVAGLYAFPSDLDGAGETIGILEFAGGYRVSDLQHYFGELNLDAPAVIDVSVASAHNRPGEDGEGADVEVALDIEVAGAIAPASTLVVYFAPN